MHPSAQSFLNFIEFEKRYSKLTLESYQNDLKQFHDFLAKNESSEIPFATHTDIRNWVVSLMEARLTARSINRKISTLKSFYKFLMKKGEIKKNPVSKVQSPKMSKRLPVFVEQPGIDKLLTQIEFPEG